MSISKEEYLNDYTNIDYLENSGKIEIANKYGITSKKKNDIYNAIALYAREERKTRKEFDSDDITMFNRLDWSERTFINYIIEESIEFQKYFLQYTLSILKTFKVDKYIYAKNLNSYGLSSNEKMYIKRFQALDSHLKELDMSAEDKLKANEISTLKNSIKARLEENLQEFHNELINQSKGFAKRRYNSIKNEHNELINKLINSQDSNSNKILRNKFSKVTAFLTRFKTIESFIDECVKDAEKDFDKNINLIVERVFDKELDVANINCSSPTIDNNRINLVITDGKKRLYCRAIIAAEFSAVMVPHVRFIVTEKK